jgi:glycosyltransferase A (GT-A) superfamily protein (DUF2064 family)
MLLNSPTLVIFCKRPKLHQGKQRLASSIGAEAALNIANALLNCAIEDAQYWQEKWQGNVVIACAHSADIPWAKKLLTNADIQHYDVISQCEYELAPAQLNSHKPDQDNLGVRLNFIDQTLRKKNHQQLVFIGTDAPILKNAHYQATLTALKQNDIVLNHADDGGVVIMANNKPWPDLKKLPWSTELLSEALSTHCQKSGLNIAFSKAGYDIDHLQDLQKLQLNLIDDYRPARQHLYKEINALAIFITEKKQCMT